MKKFLVKILQMITSTLSSRLTFLTCIFVLVSCTSVKNTPSQPVFELKIDGHFYSLNTKKDLYTRSYSRRLFPGFKTRSIKLNLTDADLEVLKYSFYQNKLDSLPDFYSYELCSFSLPSESATYRIFTDNKTFKKVIDPSMECENPENKMIIEKERAFHNEVWGIISEKETFKKMKPSNIIHE